MNSKKKIIVAIDTIDTNEALKITKLIPDVGAFKLGLEYFCANGPKGISKISETGVKIFLDLKFHDIPNTVAGAIRSNRLVILSAQFATLEVCKYVHVHVHAHVYMHV